MNSKPIIELDCFNRVDIRVGQVVRAEKFPQARKPALKVWIDFGASLGVKQTSAQITENYTPEALIGKQVLAIVNLPPRRIGPFLSEVLLLGAADSHQNVALLGVDAAPLPNAQSADAGGVPNGAPVY